MAAEYAIDNVPLEDDYEFHTEACHLHMYSDGSYGEEGTAWSTVCLAQRQEENPNCELSLRGFQAAAMQTDPAHAEFVTSEASAFVGECMAALYSVTYVIQQVVMERNSGGNATLRAATLYIDNMQVVHLLRPSNLAPERFRVPPTPLCRSVQA